MKRILVDVINEWSLLLRGYLVNYRKFRFPQKFPLIRNSVHQGKILQNIVPHSEVEGATKMNISSSRYCETVSMEKCQDGYFGEPVQGLCGPCTCKVEENEDPVCDKDGSKEKDSFPGKCFCKVTN